MSLLFIPYWLLAKYLQHCLSYRSCAPSWRTNSPGGLQNDRAVSKYSHDPRCLLEDSSICQIQLTCQLFDFLDGAGWDGLDLDDDRRAGFVDQDAFDALP